ncbi:MAG: GNAT family N-acetyltransferase [Clostridia bacterium]|nr:GNAT family N-acetyltransferase [Clostridia bacterium]
MKIILERAQEKDAERIYEMQKEAFSELLMKYCDYDTSPAGEPLSRTVERLRGNNTYFYFIFSDGEIVGAIRVVDYKDENKQKRISPLFVLPRFRRRGIAALAMAEVEKIHGSSNWMLETILEEEGNCRLYEKAGYAQSGEKRRINEKMTLVIYRK